MIVLLIVYFIINRSLPENTQFRARAELFLNHLSDTHGNDPDVETIKQKFKNNYYYFKENDEYTGFIKGYGRLVGICSKTSEDKDVQVNDMLFVFIHELAHCVCQTYDHDTRFWEKLHKLENYAKEINLIDFSTLSESVCGVNVVRPGDVLN